MLVRPRQTFGVLSVSALDLFAASLGVFILMALFLLPFYLREPSVEQALEGALHRFADLTRQAQTLETEATARARERARLAGEIAQLQQRLRTLQATAAAMQEEVDQAVDTATVPTVDRQQSHSNLATLSIADLDVVFVMDTTGSMGEELEDFRANLIGIVRVLHRLAPTLRVGFVAFKDRGEDYVTRRFDLQAMDDANLAAILRFVNALTAGGGGDRPEPVGTALAEAVAMPWRAEAQGRIIVIGDAPAHQGDWQATYASARSFRESGAAAGMPRSVSAIFTGSRPQTRAFFARLASEGGGELMVHRGQMIESVLLSVLR